MINCQATFCTPFKVCQNWSGALLETSNCENQDASIDIIIFPFEWSLELHIKCAFSFIENTLKIDCSGRNFNIVEKGKKNAYGECRKNFNDSSFSRGTLSKCRLYKM
jgi:hypothetical protein